MENNSVEDESQKSSIDGKVKSKPKIKIFSRKKDNETNKNEKIFTI